MSGTNEGEKAEPGSSRDAGAGTREPAPAEDAAGEGGADEPGEADASVSDIPNTRRPKDNMVRNPGFEQGTASEGCPDEWRCAAYRPAGAGLFATDGRTAYRESQSARWQGDGTPGTVIKQTHPSGAGRTYEVSAWVKGEALATAPFIQVLFHGSDGAIRHEKFTAEEDAGEWTHITGETTEAPAGTVSVHFNLSTDATGGTVWWDDAAMYQTSEGDDGSEPGPVDYETIEAAGQVIRLSDGEVWENKLIDFTTGGDFTVVTDDATNWTIRNVGFKGRKRSPGSVFAVTDPKGGTAVMQNIYMGDGSGRNGGRATCPSTDCTHGPVGIWVNPNHSGHLVFRHINVQGWPNNGIYASAPGSNGNGERGTIHIDQSYGANNYVSSFRIAGRDGNRITDSVAFNDGSDYNGRPIWVWKPGPVLLSGLDVDDGGFGGAIYAGANGVGTRVTLEDSEVQGPIRENHGSTVTRSGVGSAPVLDVPAGVPTTAEEAAGGRAGR